MTQEEIKTRLQELRAAHRAIDNRVQDLSFDATISLLDLRDLKKKKLKLKDKITYFESKVIPDIIA